MKSFSEPLNPTCCHKWCGEALLPRVFQKGTGGAVVDSAILAALFGVGGLVVVACWAVFYATREKYKGAARAIEMEAAFREAEVVRLSTPPPPPSEKLSVPPLEPFMVGGSMVPPPPAYLFDLPKPGSAVQWQVQPLQPFEAFFPPSSASLAPPKAPGFAASDEAPETPRTEHSALIAQSMLPPSRT